MEFDQFNWSGAVPTGDSHHQALRTPEDAMVILRNQCLELCGGSMPTNKAQRVALVTMAISALTLKTAGFLKRQHPNASVEQLAASGQHAMALLSSAATFVVLDLFDFDFDQFMSEMAGSGANHRTPWMKFSDN